jgi:hypothetical protein
VQREHIHTTCMAYLETTGTAGQEVYTDMCLGLMMYHKQHAAHSAPFLAWQAVQNPRQRSCGRAVCQLSMHDSTYQTEVYPQIDPEQPNTSRLQFEFIFVPNTYTKWANAAWNNHSLAVQHCSEVLRTLLVE